MFDFNTIAQYKKNKKFLDGYPEDFKTFFSPEDDLHGLLVALISSTQHSLVMNMFAYDDDDIDAQIHLIAKDPSKYLQMSLDKSQADTVDHEKAILANWSANIGNSIAIGTSSKHAISHLKVAIVDGIYVICGSTNWSMSGEQDQDNQLTVHRNPVVAAEYRAILDINHAYMLSQMKEPPRHEEHKHEEHKHEEHKV